MIPGGIMISHDYDILAGVRQAFAEFLQDKPEGLHRTLDDAVHGCQTSLSRLEDRKTVSIDCIFSRFFLLSTPNLAPQQLGWKGLIFCASAVSSQLVTVAGKRLILFPRRAAMGWLKSKGIQKLGGGFLERFGIRSWSRVMMAALASRKDAEALKLIRQVFRDKRSLMTSYEMWIIYSLARAQMKMPGAIAEVGVFKAPRRRSFANSKATRRCISLTRTRDCRRLRNMIAASTKSANTRAASNRCKNT